MLLSCKSSAFARGFRISETARLRDSGARGVCAIFVIFSPFSPPVNVTYQQLLFWSSWSFRSLRARLLTAQRPQAPNRRARLSNRSFSLSPHPERRTEACKRKQVICAIMNVSSVLAFATALEQSTFKDQVKARALCRANGLLRELGAGSLMNV